MKSIGWQRRHSKPGRYSGRRRCKVLVCATIRRHQWSTISLKNVRTLFSKLGEAEKLRIRINAIDEDAGRIPIQVQAMVASIAPELGDVPADDVVVRLNALLSENRSRHKNGNRLKSRSNRQRRNTGIECRYPDND